MKKQNIHTNEKAEKELKEITDKLEKGIKELFEGERYKEYLRVMSKFYRYSYNNSILIAMQCPGASLVAGYSAWIHKFGRHVKAGEKGIRIIGYTPYRVRKEVPVADPITHKPMTDAKGKTVTESRMVEVPYYKPVYVYDVTQTEGRELPTIAAELQQNGIAGYEKLYNAITQISPVPISFQPLDAELHGYYDLKEKRIVIREGMSELQTLKTVIHEIAHAMLHDIDLNAPKEEIEKRPDRYTREVEAESIAYAVCQYYHLDTSEYSFGYIAGWSKSKNLDELKQSLDTIHDTAANLIGEIEERFLTEEREQTTEITDSVRDKLKDITQKKPKIQKLPSPEQEPELS